MDAGAVANARESATRISLLHWAVRKNTDAAAVTAAVQALLEAGADVRAKAGEGLEPLHSVSLNENAEAAAAAVQALVAAGADVRARSSIGKEPLHAAARNKTRLQQQR